MSPAKLCVSKKLNASFHAGDKTKGTTNVNLHLVTPQGVDIYNITLRL